jgi:hypothetical protein
LWEDAYRGFDYADWDWSLESCILLALGKIVWSFVYAGLSLLSRSVFHRIRSPHSTDSELNRKKSGVISDSLRRREVPSYAQFHGAFGSCEPLVSECIRQSRFAQFSECDKPVTMGRARLKDRRRVLAALRGFRRVVHWSLSSLSM